MLGCNGKIYTMPERLAKDNDPAHRQCYNAISQAKPGLPRRMAPINPQIAPRHKATRITDAKHRRPTVLLRQTELAQHILRRPIPPPLGELLKQCFYHGGYDVARRDGVDADAVGAPFGGEVAGELDHAGFGGVVGGADEALLCERERLAMRLCWGGLGGEG